MRCTVAAEPSRAAPSRAVLRHAIPCGHTGGIVWESSRSFTLALKLHRVPCAYSEHSTTLSLPRCALAAGSSGRAPPGTKASSRPGSTARGMLHVGCCTLHVGCCTWHAARGMLHAACCTWDAARCTWHVARGTLHVARGMLHAARDMLYVAVRCMNSVLPKSLLPYSLHRIEALGFVDSRLVGFPIGPSVGPLPG
jgi:hypothetical protein